MKKATTALLYLLFLSSAILISCVADEGLSNSDPVIENQTFTVSASAPDGENIGTISASDDDGDALTFTLLSGNINSVFVLNANSGVLSVASATELSTSLTPSYNLIVQVSDGKESASATITVDVEGIIHIVDNTPPTILPQTFEVRENTMWQTPIGTVVASDIENDDLTFSISEGNDDDHFELDEKTGELTIGPSDYLDFETTPTFNLKIQVSDGAGASEADITINLTDEDPERFRTEAEVLAGLAQAYDLFEEFVEYSYLFDAVYSNTIASPSTDWDAVHNHTLTASNEKVLKLWEDAYELIYLSYNVWDNAHLVTSQNLNGQGEFFVAAAYLQLMNWFGEVPLEFHYAAEENPLFATTEEISDLLIDLLTVGENNLSSTKIQDSNGNFIVTDDLAKALRLRVLIFEDDYAQIRATATEVIESGDYTLSEETDDFNPADPEVFWVFEKSSGTEFSSLFPKGDYVPLSRLTEMHLLDLVARVNLGETSNDLTEQILYGLLFRNDPISTPGPPYSANEILDHVYQLYSDEMYFEGIDFATMKRLGDPITELGIQDFQLVLPIPQAVLDNNENAVQNPGY